MSDQPVKIAVIGGSGLYKMPGLTDIEQKEVSTPFGPPSDAITIGTLDGIRVAFLARHGRGHVHLPHEVPYRANIYALKSLGVERVISVSACGSLKEELAPGHIVIPDQLYDNTKHRNSTFFGDGLAAHVSVADPFCGDLWGMLSKAARGAGGSTHEGGSFITIEGPRFSTRAESNVFRTWGMSIIGMTTSPEAYLAREAELCYAVMAHVTDYDVWHETEEAVTVNMVVRTLKKNVVIARKAIRALVGDLARQERTCACQHALADALITDRDSIPPATRDALKLLIGKYID